MIDQPNEIAWYLQTTFDRNVAYPGETLYTAAMLTNPNPYPIFIGAGYWSFSCYPNNTPGIKRIDKIIPANDSIPIPPWSLPIPSIIEGKYESRISFQTWKWDYAANNWIDLGIIQPNRGEDFYIIHVPRFRAFISRSNRDADRPVVEAIISLIQKWGFDCHTVGINELEPEGGNIPARIIQEIIKSDCVFAIATPRDVSVIPAVTRTLTWLHNEVSFSFMAEKPTLVIADQTINLDGLIGSSQILNIKYQQSMLNDFLLYLNQLMPVIRKILVESKYNQWVQTLITEIQNATYQGFITGMLVQKRLLLDK